MHLQVQKNSTFYYKTSKYISSGISFVQYAMTLLYCKKYGMFHWSLNETVYHSSIFLDNDADQVNCYHLEYPFAVKLW